MTTTDRLPPGFADVILKASLKTHLPGEYLLESGSSPYGGPFYHLTVNVDGQAVPWKVPGQRKNITVVRDRHSRV